MSINCTLKRKNGKVGRFALGENGGLHHHYIITVNIGKPFCQGQLLCMEVDPMTSSLGYGTIRLLLSAMRLRIGALDVLYGSTAT